MILYIIKMEGEGTKIHKNMFIRNNVKMQVISLHFYLKTAIKKVMVIILIKVFNYFLFIQLRSLLHNHFQKTINFKFLTL